MLAMFIIIVASCKSKQLVSKSVSKDSTELVKIDEVINQKIHFVVKYPHDDNGSFADSLKNNLLLLPLLDDSYDKPSFCLPYIPGMEIDYQFDMVQNKKSDKKTNVIDKSKNREIIPQHKDSSCHYVIWFVIFAVFLCLVVRYRKKIAKIFGRLRKNIYLRSV